MSDKIELLPCPFCGGEAYVSELRDGMWRAICKSCNASGNNYFTKAEAIEAWNTRAERTCKNISDPPEGFYCSSCGWGDFAEPSHLLTTAKFSNNDSGPNYCPNCGAKVVSE